MRLAGDFRAEMFEQSLGVIARRFGFDHGGLARRGKTREQHRRLELRRRHRRFVGDRQRIGGALQRQRQTVAVGRRDDARAHLLQRIEHPPHRPRPQRRIAVEGGGDPASRYRADRQPAAGAGIAEIQGARRLGKAADTDAVNAPAALARPFDLGAERPHGGGGVEDIFALQKTADGGLADRHRPQNKGAVRDRFVARHADTALERAPTASGKGRQLRG